MKKFVLSSVLACTFICWGQVETTPEDVADKLGAGKAAHQQQLLVFAAAERILKSQVDLGVGPSDLLKMAPFIHLAIKKCLANGDHSRSEAALYGAAAAAAGRVAVGWEQRATTSAASGAQASEAEFRQQLEEIDKRLKDLNDKPNLTEVEHAEKSGLDSRGKSLRDALVILAQMRSATGDNSRFADAAKRMRMKEQAFRIQEQEAKGQYSFFDVQCQANDSILRALGDYDRLERELSRWGKVPGGEVQVEGALPTRRSKAQEEVPTVRAALSAAQAEIQRLSLARQELEAQVAQFKQLFSDPALLQQQIDHLNNLTNPARP